MCIIGDVGSGKSSLLSALLGDLLYMSESQIKKYGGEIGLQKEIANNEEIEDFQKDLISGTKEMYSAPPITVNGSIAYV